jgi:hypothetical protein
MSDNASKYDPAYCKELLIHMASGCSYATFGAVAGVKFRTMKTWEKTHAEWADAVELGQLTLMYTWEKIIIGQARGDIKGLPATTIFALKNYFPEKFKENTALQGNGNTIVVFDSGVPIKTIETTATTLSNSKPRIIEAEIPEKPHNTVSNQVLPDFMVNADIPVKTLDSQQFEAGADIITTDDI